MRTLASLLLLLALVHPARGAQPGRVVLSDGKQLRGTVRFPVEKLRLTRGRKRAVRIPIQAIAAIHVIPWRQRSYMVGSGDEKRSEAPILEFRMRVVLRNGACMWGNLSSTFSLETARGKRRKFALTRLQRGKPGQTEKDLLRVLRLEFAKVPARLPCQVTLRPDPKIGQITSVLVLGMDSQHLRPMRKAEDGSWWADGLWPDRYDLLVVTPTRVFLSLSGQTPTMPADVLTYLRRREIGRLLSRQAGEGVKRRALQVAGRVRRCRVLVLEESARQGQRATRRLDIYQMEYVQGRWQIVFTVPVYRDVATDKGLIARWIDLRKGLAVVVTEKAPSASVTLPDQRPADKR